MSVAEIFKGISASWVLNATRILNGLVLMPLYFKFVDEKLLGAWLVFVSLSSFFLLSDLGLAMVLSRTLAWHKGLKEGGGKKPEDLDAQLLEAKPGNIYKTVSRAYWGLGLMVMIIGGAAGWFYLGSLDLSLVQLTEVRAAWLIYSLGVCFVLAGSAPNYALSGLGDIALESMARASGFLLTMILSYLVLSAGHSIVALAWVFLFQTVVVRLVLAFLLRRRHPWLFELKSVFENGLLKIMMGQAIPIFITQLGALFVFQVNPVLIVYVLGTAALPDYNVMLVLAMYGGQIAMAIPQTLMPFIAAKKAAGDVDQIKDMLRLALKAVMALVLMYAVVLMSFGENVLEIWVGPGHYLGGTMLMVMVFLYSLEYHHQAHSQFAWGIGKWPYAKISVVAGILNVIFVWFGLKHYGLLGAAVGTAAAQFLTSNWYVPVTVLKMLNIKKSNYFRKVLLPLLIFVLLFGAFGLFLKRSLMTSGLSNLQIVVLGLATLALFGFPSVWKFLFSENDRQAFMMAIKRKNGQA